MESGEMESGYMGEEMEELRDGGIERWRVKYGGTESGRD
jgi:hypothetical protein